MNPTPHLTTARHRTSWSPGLAAPPAPRGAVPARVRSEGHLPWSGWPPLGRDYLRDGATVVRELRTERIRERGRGPGRTALHLHLRMGTGEGGTSSGRVGSPSRPTRMLRERVRWERTLRTLAPAAVTDTSASRGRGLQLEERNRPAPASVVRRGTWLPEPRVFPRGAAGEGTVDSGTREPPVSTTPRERGSGPLAPLVAPADVNRIADQVMKTLDRRLTAYRERRGRGP